MKIESAELRIVPLKLRERFEISSGYRDDRKIILLTLRANGLTGWSECVAAEDPSYSYETTETAWHVLVDFLLPAIVGREFSSPAEVYRAMDGVRGHPMAKAAIERGAWDLHARKSARPLAEAIGGVLRPVDVGVSIGLQSDDQALVEKVGGYVESGYKRIKMKIKPGRDVEMLSAVRNAFPDLPILADANSAYTLDDAPALHAMDDLNLMMIEQPLGSEDIHEHARLQEQLKTPICLDESIRSPGDARLAIQLNACGVINVKPGRVGGFTNAIQIHDLCRSAGIDAWVGGMLESGVGRAFNVALATLPGFTLPGDISASKRYWNRDLVAPEWELQGGQIEPIDAPGIGVLPDESMIERETIRKQVVR